MSLRSTQRSCEDFVDKLVPVLEQHLPAALGELAMEDRLRLAGLERFVIGALSRLREELWQLAMAKLAADAEAHARVCRCGKRREARDKRVEVKVLGTTMAAPCTYYYCRDCHLGESPVRAWLGVEAGDTSLELERALTDLTERMTFGDAVSSLCEQQGQTLDRTQAERITYRVADQAATFLTERRNRALGDQTEIHGVFDMGSWIHTQFEAQFDVYPHTACADICHVTAYLTNAGRQLVGAERACTFGMEHKRRLLEGQTDAVRARLARHSCNGRCLTDERGDCLVHVARRYLDNHRRYLDYPPILRKDLPVGSGEAESGIRHLIKKRLDVAGAWREDNAKRILALMSVRASGLWSDFWHWRDEQDRADWHRRQRRELRKSFRGRPRRPQNAPIERAPAVAA